MFAPTFPSKPFSRLQNVKEGSVARLSKKIKKKLVNVLEKPKKRLKSKCLSLELEHITDGSYELPEKDLNKVIEANRKLYTKKNFRYHPKHGELEMFKPLVLKYYEKVQRWLNPIQSIRIFDYTIYMDTTALQDKITSRKKLPALTMDSFKRIVAITHNTNKHTYKYLLEEKYPNSKRMQLGVESFRYLTRFLDSMGSKVARGFSVTLSNTLDNLRETNRKLSALFDETLNGKRWIRRLNKGTKDFIKSCPYQKRKNVFDESRHGLTNELVINQKFIDATGVFQGIDTERGGWEFLYCWVTACWMTLGFE